MQNAPSKSRPAKNVLKATKKRKKNIPKLIIKNNNKYIKYFNKK